MGTEIMTSLLLLLVVCRVCGEFAERLGQPAMLGEIAAGVLLGPSALDVVKFSPELKGISELGVFLLLLLAGMEIDPLEFIKGFRGRASWAPILGFFVPLAFGILVGHVFGFGATCTVFLGLCVAITALPVSVRVLMDLGKLDTPVGRTIVPTAVANDMTAFLLLGVILDFRGGGAAWGQLVLTSLLTLTKTLFFMAVMVGAYRLVRYSTGVLPASRKLLEVLVDNLKGKETLFAVTLLFVMIFASFSEAVGFHFVIGTFFGGMLLGREIMGPERFEEVKRTASGMTMGFLAPVFFASLGLQFEAGTLQDLPLVLAVLAAAFSGKILGGYWGGRLTGLSKGESWTLGFGLNGRGVMELVIANLGLSNGLIDPKLFSILILMGVATTMVTPILLKRSFQSLEPATA